MGGVVSEIQARLALIEKFPALEGSGFDVTSPIDYGYNCIAWAAGGNSKWWWPGNSETFWPAGCDRGVKVRSFVEAFQNLGYKKCKLEDDWTQFEYVAIYKLNGSPSHAARQLEDGRWTSKTGPGWDITHPLAGLNGVEYGQPTLFMKRPRS
jgi:hypothetical protein